MLSKEKNKSVSFSSRTQFIIKISLFGRFPRVDLFAVINLACAVGQGRTIAKDVRILHRWVSAAVLSDAGYLW